MSKRRGGSDEQGERAKDEQEERRQLTRFLYVHTHTRALFKSLLGAVRVAVYTTAEFYRASGGSIKSVYSLAGPIDYIITFYII